MEIKTMGELPCIASTWLSCIITLPFAYFVASSNLHYHETIAKLVSLSPVIYFISTLPWQFSSIHLQVASAVVFWTCSSKLFLVCFNQGPLADLINTRKSIFKFILLAAFPVKLKKKSSPPLARLLKILLILFLKSSALMVVLKLYAFKHLVRPQVLWIPIYMMNVYLPIDLMLTCIAIPVQLVLRTDLEPQFDRPYKATSLAEFWGKRWNIAVNDMLKYMIYKPIRVATTKRMSYCWSRVIGVLVTFSVSGIVHEVLFCLLRDMPPTWEISCFFVLQGLLVLVEEGVKHEFKWLVGVNRFVSNAIVINAITMTIMVVTASWLFFPPLLGAGLEERTRDEYLALKGYLMQVVELWK